MEPKLRIEHTCLAQLNFAMQQNYIPLIRSLRIISLTDERLENIRIKISFEPAFAAVFETVLPVIQPGETVELSPVRLTVFSEYLYSLTEKMLGSITVEAFSGEELLCSVATETELLPCDQWTGAFVMPELTAAFVTPNHPKIAEITAKASRHLMKWCGDPAFTGYQTQDPNMAKKQFAALYAALQEENIAYTMPPASFEAAGQRVRLPHAVLEQKQGTCLDLALLLAACAEAVGLHPLVVIVKGHAFAGCWLEEETFSDCTVEDVSAITKRTAAGIDAICLAECTDYTAGKSVSFDRAEKHANDHLNEIEDFRIAVDVVRCRGNGIRPIPVRTADNGGYQAADNGQRKEADITGNPAEIDMARHAVTAQAKEMTRQDMWERKLLDLSLRNSLLNFRPGTMNLQFMTADLGRLEDEVSRGESFKIMPAPSEAHLELSDSKIFEIENDKDLISTIAEAEFKSRRLRTFLSETELERVLKKLHRQAKVSLEENGANTLYLALGFLRWFETDKSTRARYAPLVLIPVDLVRKITDKSYSLRVRGEDVQVNVTLLEMLRQDHGIHIDGLDPPPEDESGVDLALIFNTVRQAVMSKEKWDITEIAVLGQFSFSQFIMWNDIRNRSEELKTNKVVSSLISGKLEWSPQELTITPAELDEKVSPSEMAVPLSADSSQLSAVYAASQGESFVLHGPPGTGKSQTITNMIANALYNGKTVLFVAEKMAALSVVQKRLANLGLEPFCLELHSNKSQKRAVLGQLEKTLSVGHIKSPEEYARAAEELKKQREALNGIMNALHRKQPIGMSLYEAVTVYESLAEYQGRITLDNKYAENTDSAKYQTALELLGRIAAADKEIGGYTGSPLKNYRRIDYSIEIRDSFRKEAERLPVAVDKAEQTYQKLLTGFSIEPAYDHSSYTKIIDVLELSREGRFFADALEVRSPLAERKEEYDVLFADGAGFRQLTDSLLSEFDAGILSVDGAAAKLAWKQNEQKWFLPKFFGKNKLLKTMKAYAKNAGAVTEASYISVCDRLTEYAALKGRLTGADASLTECFGALWKQENTNFVQLEELRDNTLSIRKILSELKAPTVTEAVKNTSDRDGSILSDAQNARGEVMSIIGSLQDGYAVDLTELYNSDNWFWHAKKEAEGWLSGISLLRERSVLEGLLAELSGSGLEAVTSALRSGSVTADSLSDAFRCEAARVTISDAMAKSTELSGFQGTQFEVSLERYRQAAKDFESLTVQELVSRLSARIPAATDSVKSGSSEVSILQRAIRSGGRMLSIRKLFDSIPALLRRMCPCMLMSPISVAQYIDPSLPKFDLVIFDEASQLPTSEAVGAVSRGENMIVVGDPKQLPPTSFFSVQHTDEENYDKEDLESVLDDCLALAMPQKHLLWHYRSRHESLIAFSNAKFYDNKLLTFPSPDDLMSKVTRVPVEGFYDKGKTKQNRAEAEAVVREIVRRLSDEALRRESLGVVTFSVVQQNLIDDLLADEFVKDPQLEAWADSMYEPIFIKNLENVQGDERDVILFSVGYGPDKNGQVSMNFGPLNQDGGWRRLNVAVSRARKSMIVFSVLRYDQIDLSRTRSEGVAQLRAFLEFADRGSNSLARGASDKVYENDGFAELLAHELSKQGYEVRCGVGCSGFRIDAAIVHPDDPDRYILGLQCGSSASRSISAARDRNIVQPSVLKGLDWNICNVHILDWLDNKERVIEKIKAEVESALSHSADEDIAEESSKPQVYNAFTFETEKILSPAEQCSIYVPCELSDMGTAEDFYQPASRSKIEKAIRTVIEREAPVSRKTVMKKVISAWGMTRSGNRVEQCFDEALRKVAPPSTVSNGMEFFWREDQDPESYDGCRISDGPNKRSMDEICTEEIRNGITRVLRSQISMPKSELIRETAKLFGFSRSGAVTESAVEAALLNAQELGLIVCNEDRISLPE